MTDETTRRPFTRRQRMTVLSGMLAFVLMAFLWYSDETLTATLGGSTLPPLRLRARLHPRYGGQAGGRL